MNKDAINILFYVHCILQYILILRVCERYHLKILFCIILSMQYQFYNHLTNVLLSVNNAIIEYFCLRGYISLTKSATAVITANNTNIKNSNMHMIKIIEQTQGMLCAFKDDFVLGRSYTIYHIILYYFIKILLL